MSQPMQNRIAGELRVRVPPLLSEIDTLFIAVRDLTADSLELRHPELSMDGIRAGCALSKAESYLKRLQRSLRWTINGILPPGGGSLGEEDEEEDDDDDT